MILDNPFSILERIVVVETADRGRWCVGGCCLSVSSNGSWWLKRKQPHLKQYQRIAFSILERIVVVETLFSDYGTLSENSFSILERIVVVETSCPFA